MPKKPLHSRLENLFSDLAGNGSDAQEPGKSAPEQPLIGGANLLTGWTWEVDADLHYTACEMPSGGSIALRPEQVIGRSFLDAAIHPKYCAILEKAFAQPNLPVEVDVFIKGQGGKWVPARVHILKKTGPDQGGWQGFTQLLPGEPFDDSTAHVSAATPVATRPVLLPHKDGAAKDQRPGGGTQPSPQAQAPSDVPADAEARSLPEEPSPTDWKLDQFGFALQDGRLVPSTHIWTSAGEQSLVRREPAFEDSNPTHPATIAVPFQMQGVGDLLLEVVDDNHEREWNEDDRFLVMEIVNQLTLALDNAQLYISAQQELAERVRAEQVILRRNKDLATLNQIGQQLSRLTTRAEIFDLLAHMIEEVLNSQNYIICTYHPTRQTLSFPVYCENRQRLEVGELAFGKGIAEYVIRHRTPLLVEQNVVNTLLNMEIELPRRLPASLLAIPLLTGERAIGAILVQDFNQEKAFDQIHLELLSTAAAQATTALENADLFQQMQDALKALETRERYQSNVAKAAATLTEFGAKSMPEVLKLLGQAAGCSRIYFAQIKEDERGIYWSSTSEWLDPSVAYLFDKTRIQHIPVASYPEWVKRLTGEGWCITTADVHSPEAEFLASQHIHTSLLLAVPAEGKTPSFLAFDQIGVARAWQSEEINALRVAADAITNTFVREDLLMQLRVSLDETESLYKASNRLALANDMQEMVAAVLSGIRSPNVNRAVLLLFEYDSFEKVAQITVGANWYSGRGTPPPPVGTALPRARFERFLQIQSPVFYEDVQEAQGIDAEVRENLLQQNIRGLAVLPLWTGKRQVGALLIQSETKYRFSGRETRTYPPLADQMAIAVENQTLFEQTQRALAETELLYNVSNRIAQAADAQDILALVVESVLPEGADRASLFLIEGDNKGELLELEMVGYHDLRGEYTPLGQRIPIDALPLVRGLTDQPILIPSIDLYPLDPASHQTLEQFQMISACLVPLRTSGRLIGMIAASARKAVQYDLDQTRLLHIVGNGIAVSMEKQRLLRQAQRRALELQTASEIARDTTSTLSLDLLLNRIVNMLCERFNFYHASIFLLDDSGSYAVIRESTGQAGQEMKNQGHRLAVGSKSVVGTVTATGEPYILNDVLHSPIYFPNPLLPETRSEMGMPLKISNKVIGALDLQSRNPNAFNADDVAVLQILADQIAIAIENARAYELSQKAIADMKEVDRVKNQFLANMSHELRTPLNSIIGFSRVILKGIDGPINDTQKQDLTAIYNSGQHLLSLINDILDLAKIDAGKMELAFADVNVADMVNSVMSTAMGLVKDKPIKLVAKVPENLPMVRADQTRVRQVIINFLSNAAKFTEEGSITVEVSLVTSPKTGHPEVMITVTDSGPGIAPQDQAKLFLPFSQVDDSPTRKTGGTGLGLSICRSLIEMHGGRIGLLWSEVGKGSTFFFTLPANLPTPAVAPADPNFSSNVILAVDDDLRVIQLYERYLKPHGYQVMALTDPKEAVKRAKEVRPFAITLDIMMPEKDGWQVMRDLKNDPETRDLPIIILSILENQEKGFSMGAADYLVKPFLEEDLINAINRLNRDGTISKVLVIDDDAEDLRLVQKLLDNHKQYHITFAQGGQAGWDAIQAQRPDAIILDLFMPGLNGFTILENLRADPALRSIPVLVLTGADLTPEQHHQLSEFGQGLLAKGYLREKELLMVLEEALRKFKPTPQKEL